MLCFGLPQRRVLPPILFLIYVNVLLKQHNNNGVALPFANDTVLVFSGNSWKEEYGFANLDQVRQNQIVVVQQHFDTETR